MPSTLTLPVGPRDHVDGPESAPVTLVEYGDFECPQCAAAYPIVERLRDTFGARLRFVFRHFPLTNVHPYAELAAEVAEAAGSRDRFWPMHDWLFEHQRNINPRHLMVGVEQIELPADVIARETSAHRYIDRIRRDFVGGVRSGVNGTPTFYVNGVRHDGGYTLDELLEAVDEAAETVGAR